MTKTYKQIQEQIDMLQREAEKLKKSEIAGVVAKIKDAITAYGLTAADLGLTSAGGRRVAVKRATRKTTKSAGSEAKFRDSNGNVWGGRGPRPQWLRAAIEAGSKLEDFAV